MNARTLGNLDRHERQFRWKSLSPGAFAPFPSKHMTLADVPGFRRQLRVPEETRLAQTGRPDTSTDPNEMHEADYNFL